MCTAVSYRTEHHYFGRNLDLDRSFGEQIVITPRNFPLRFRCISQMSRHYAMIGIGIVEDGEPLYYDAVNERGLGIAGLHFPGLAVYQPEKEGVDNVASFEIIPWLLGQCADVKEALIRLNHLNVTDISFSAKLPPAPLHWMISDRERTVVAEPRGEGLRIYDNPARVLTNNPAFDYHLCKLNDYMGLTPEFPVNRFSEDIPLRPYCLGMGAMGLPGDLSSASRFVRSAFTRAHALTDEGGEQKRRDSDRDRETFSVTQFFHILGSVEQTLGCAHTPEGGYERTVYTSCCNTDRGIYYYTTYGNRRITAVDLYQENLNGMCLSCYSLRRGQDISYQNRKTI